MPRKSIRVPRSLFEVGYEFAPEGGVTGPELEQVVNPHCEEVGGLSAAADVVEAVVGLRTGKAERSEGFVELDLPAAVRSLGGCVARRAWCSSRRPGKTRRGTCAWV